MINLNTFLAVAFLTLATASFAQVQKIQNLQITGGSPGAGKFLVSDANGNASWQTAGQAGLVISGESVVNTTVVPVTSATGKIWMDRNLGASRVAQSFNDYMAYGSLYQWGRGNDGHQLINWTSATAGTPVNGTTTSIRSTTDTPGHNLFISLTLAPYDWRNLQNNNLWQGVTGINNPCPAEYRLPTITEITNEVTAYSITNRASAFASPLKFTVPCNRLSANGTLSSPGSNGYYWSSSVSGIFASFLYFDSSAAFTSNDARAYGFTVRCLKN